MVAYKFLLCGNYEKKSLAMFYLKRTLENALHFKALKSKVLILKCEKLEWHYCDTTLPPNLFVPTQENRHPRLRN
jgi:hypothetical protein